MKFPRLHRSKFEKTPEKAPDADKGKQADVTDKSKTPPLTDQTSEAKKGLYVYCIVPSDSPKEYGRIGVKNDSSVYAVPFKDVAAVVSEFEGESFERTDANVLAHQRIVHKVFEAQVGVPVRFGTIREDEEDVRQVLEEGYPDFKKQLTILTPKVGEDSVLESGAPTDIIAEILSQSAASAVRIRQLADTLETVKRQEYEKGAAKLPEGTAKELLDFLARAPPGAYQTSEAASADTDQVQSLERRLDTLFEEIDHLKDMIATQGESKGVSQFEKEQGESKGVSQFEKEQGEIKEAVLGFRAFQELLNFLARAPPGAYQTSEAASADTDQVQSLERRLDTLFEEIDHLKDMIATQGESKGVSQFEKEQGEIKEAVLGLRAFQDENKLSLEKRKTVSQAIKEQMSKLPPTKQVMLETAGKQEPYSQPVVFGANQTPAVAQTMQTYYRCQGCGAGIVITDRFCPHCGRPNYEVFGANQTPAVAQTMQTYYRCQGCGAGIVITDRFCPHCGRPNYESGT